MQSGQENTTQRRFCNCSRYCGNRQQEVSERTYYRHAQARHADQFSSEFTEFLRSEPPVRDTDPRKRQNTANRSTPSKRRHNGKEPEKESAYNEPGTSFNDADTVSLEFTQPLAAKVFVSC